MWVLIIVGVLLVVAIGALVAARARRYRDIFSAAHFRAFHEGLARGIGVARGKAAGAEPSLEDGTAFATDAGLAVVITRPAGEEPTLHVSLSQAEGYTTHAVASRFGFFAVAMLVKNEAELQAFFTESGVHHLVFRLHSEDLDIQGFEAANAMYLRDYQPIDFERLAVGPGAAAGG